MLIRIITAIVALCVFIPMVIFSHTWVSAALIGVCIVIAVFESIRCIGQKKNFFLTIPLCAASMIMPLYTRYATHTDDPQSTFTVGAVVCLLVTLYVFAVAVFANKTLNIADAGLLIAMFIFANAGFTALIYVRNVAANGQYLVFLPFMVAWITDSFAYFTGRFLGKHKLLPAVSPKKTIEGAIGGTIGGALTVIIFAWVVSTFFKPAGGEGVIQANYLAFAIFGIFFPIFGQIGDLMLSVIKRNYGIKDYGKFFPGHGGMLDRFDSALANCLVLAIVCACPYFDLLPTIIS